MILKALQETGNRYSIVRKALPALKATAMRDFFYILRDNDLYEEANHNKTDNLYSLHGNEFEFFGLDQPMKVRSRRRDYLWMNEANEFTLEDYRQLSMRTNKQIYLDYNPSDQFHWIYDHVLTRKDCTLIRSTYLDNPFLPQEVVKEIESYRDLDQNYWRVYGLGERGVAQTTIYTHWQYCDELPKERDETIFGLDFGYNNQTALIEIATKDQEVFTDERLYERKMTNTDLIAWMEANQIPKDKPIYADHAEPQRIEEIKQAGYHILPADKSVEDGIDTLKRRRWFITKSSVNLLKEARSYRWKEKDGIILDEPVKANDHGMDAIRYGVHTHKLSLNQFVGFV